MIGDETALPTTARRLEEAARAVDMVEANGSDQARQAAPSDGHDHYTPIDEDRRS
jgi:NADPH-dependent ferric siderophore reductase